MTTIQYTELVDEAIYEGRIEVDQFKGDERIELITALLDQWDYTPQQCARVRAWIETLEPAAR